MSDKVIKKIVGTVIVVGIVGVLLLLFFELKAAGKIGLPSWLGGKKTDDPSPTNTTIIKTVYGDKEVSGINNNKVLRKGIYDSPSVLEAQKLMNNYLAAVRNALPKFLNLPTLTEDGDFGANTEKVLYAITQRKSITLKELTSILMNKMKKESAPKTKKYPFFDPFGLFK